MIRSFFAILFFGIGFGLLIVISFTPYNASEQLNPIDTNFFLTPKRGEDIVNETYPAILIDANCTDLFSEFWIPERGSVTDVPVEQGSITLIDGFYDRPLPICLTQEEIDDWFIKFAVIGGYQLFDGGYIDVYQKDGYVTRLYARYTDLGPAECCVELWEVRFTAPQTPITLESSYYPKIYDGMFGLWDEQPGDTIPGKHVDMDIWLNWMGCPLPDQSFTVKFRIS